MNLMRKELLKRRLCILILYFSIALDSCQLRAQQPVRFDRLGREDGLSQSAVNCMLRDREGFMWFGTQDGLNLYDGLKFRVFQNQPGDPYSLSNNYIVSICEDKDGLLWIGTMTGGLNVLDKRTGRFRVFLHSDSANSITENTVWTVMADHEGNIWAGTSVGLNRYDKTTGLFTSFLPVEGDSSSLPTEMVVSLFRDRDGGVWAGTVEGLCLVDKEKDAFVRFYNPGDADLKGANIIWSISQAPSGEIITGTDNGVYLLDVPRKQFTRFLGSPSEPQMVAWSVLAEKSGSIWTGTDRGLLRYDPATGSREDFLNNPVDPLSLVNNNVWCLLADPAGFLWAGTNGGICKTKVSAARFRLLSSEPGQSLQLSSSKVMAILEDRSGYLWIGTDGGGLNRISPDRQEVKVFNSTNSGLRNDNVWALAEDARGDIYIGNYQGGLNKFDKATGLITAYPMATGGPFALSNKRVLALLADRQGYVWIATRGSGLSRLDPGTGMFRDYAPAEGDPSGFPSNTVLSLAEDNQGRIWAGTHEGGLALYDPAADTFKSFRHIPGDERSLSDNNIWAIAFDRNGRMWIGSQGGLNVCVQPDENPRFSYYTIRDGLSSNFIMGVEEDAQGNIWMSTFNGLVKMDISAYESSRQPRSSSDSFALSHPLFTLFDTDHGLQGLEFNQGASHRGQSGTLYFGGNNGLNFFSEKDIRTSGFGPPIMITGFRIFNREVEVSPEDDSGESPHNRLIRNGNQYFLPFRITYLDALRLTYRESVISFEFASLDFSNPEKNQYAYRMENFDENWNFVATQHTATYTNLDPGEYVFLVRGTNSDGIWNPEERRLAVTIVPPLWKTGWFRIVASILSLLMVFFIVRQLFINQKRKAEREKEMVELQLRTIKSQIDPHFAFNAINSIASYIISEQPDKAYDYFTRFARMIRKILEDNETISIPLSDELDFVRNYLDLQKMRFRDKFDYVIQVEDNNTERLMVPKMLIQSFAENSIKHGLMHRTSGGLLVISVAASGSGLKVIVEDNGVGRARAAELNPGSTRRGYKIVERISELYRRLYRIRIIQQVEDLFDETGQPAGTRVILTISGSQEVLDSPAQA